MEERLMVMGETLLELLKLVGLELMEMLLLLQFVLTYVEMEPVLPLTQESVMTATLMMQMAVALLAL